MAKGSNNVHFALPVVIVGETKHVARCGNRRAKTLTKDEDKITCTNCLRMLGAKK